MVSPSAARRGLGSADFAALPMAFLETTFFTAAGVTDLATRFLARTRAVEGALVAVDLVEILSVMGTFIWKNLI